MPRRNRNASVPLVTPDMLADQIAQLASDLLACPGHASLCAACLSNPATTGDYCASCRGQITFPASYQPAKAVTFHAEERQFS
jgi:hypothetical protein